MSFMHFANFEVTRSWNYRLSFMVMACLGLFCCQPLGRAASATITATFENYSSQFLGFGSTTDPLSGITFNNLDSNGGLGISHFNDPSLASLYNNNNVLEQNVPSSGVFWSTDFSIHGVLPHLASTLSIDILYDYDSIADPAGPNGSVTLSGFDANGNLVSSVSTPPLNLSAQQTHLALSFASPISSFTVIANNLSTDYDNISFTPVPEPSAALVLLMAVAVGGRWMFCMSSQKPKSR